MLKTITAFDAWLDANRDAMVGLCNSDGMNPLANFLRERTGKYVIMASHHRWRYLSGRGKTEWHTLPIVFQEFNRLIWRRTDQPDSILGREARSDLSQAQIITRLTGSTTQSTTQTTTTKAPGVHS